MIDRAHFFEGVRKSFGKLKTSQVDGFLRILDEWERRGLTDKRWLAYMLATCWHESACTMRPISERGSKAYLERKPYWPWIGEGLVQVTWEANARKFGAESPGDLLEWPLALRALFDGMLKGMFTGKRLDQYFNARRDDPVAARRIINGQDRATKISRFHSSFLKALH